MGSRNRRYTREPSASSSRQIHPIWRGVGFGMIVLIPIISYAAMNVLLEQNGTHNWFALPVDMFARPGEFLYRIIPDPLLYIKITFFVAFVAIFFAIFTLFSFMVSSAFGPSKKDDPFYVPPLRRRVKRRY